jgi:hypothetical protein
MNPGRYFMPNMAINQTMLRNGYGLSRSGGFLGRMIAGFRSYDWGKLLTGTSKTLNVVNQTIPLVKQAKPMISNVKSMIKIARAFGKETDNKEIMHIINNNGEQIQQSKKNTDNYPNFFI